MITSGNPHLVQRQTAIDRITFVAEFSTTDPDTLFDYWTIPDMLTRWWPPVAEIDPRKDGHYHFSWPKQNWNLRGRFTEFDRGRELAFTWKWDHESIDATRVVLRFKTLPGGGTRLTMNHELYPRTTEGEKLRNEHVEGWTYFLGKLQEQAAKPHPLTSAE